MGVGKDGSISQIAQGCRPGTRQILKVGTVGYQIKLKKTLYEKRFSIKSSFMCRTNMESNGEVDMPEKFLPLNGLNTLW